MTVSTIQLGKVVDVSAGQPAPKPKDFSEDGLPFIRAGSLEGLLSGQTEDDCEKITSETARRYRMRLYPKDTILFAKSGMSAKIGRVYRMRKPAYVVSHLAALAPVGRYEPSYLAHWLRAHPPSTLIKDDAYPSIRTSEVSSLEVPDLPIDEQCRIAAILDKADAIRRKREGALSLADDFLKSAFLKMFGRPNDPNPGLKVLPLGKLCDLFAGNSLPTGVAYLGQDDGLLLLKVGDLNLPGNDQVVMTAREWVAGKGRTGAAIVAPKDAIVFPKRGGAIATNKKRVLGRSSILDPNLMAVAPKQGAPISYPYLRIWFELLDLASIANGSTVPQLNKGDLYPLEMAIPEDLDLTRFDRLFHGSKKLREKQFDELIYSETLFSALSQRAFRGEL
ncbi:hypothetical protein DJ021_07005 [Phenylobacterium hankyongense]|uniref:Type I restriction modification DNA specificity domain-containing protein n=1 Tax=Phenylobacterium hankyongense TaxID=1813876 RepID=A0A328AY93_9CAUL|nr:restriction endonuclease subunit S [Phenylobacterium hankyongense]RAK59567.1 hypothetical protein DJ021_07005 [Phenylobacterium hankyongense]